MEQDLISVIIPVYNTEKYLAACLDSVLNQSHRNLEVIVVDDGSTDFSLQIAEGYAENDDRVKVYSFRNQGQAAARNHGLDVATGKFISFVDSDDLLLPDALEILLRYLHKLDSDIVEGNFLYGDSLKHKKFKGKIFSLVYTSRNAIENIFYQKNLSSSPCGKVFKSELFKDLRFKKGIIYEDLDLTYQIFDIANKIAYINYPVYFYREVEGSTLHKWEPKRLDVLSVTKDMESYISEKYPDLLKAAKDRRLSANFNMYALCSIHGDHENASKCWNHIKANRHVSLFNPKVRLKNKAGILLSYLGKKLFNIASRKIYR